MAKISLLDYNNEKNPVSYLWIVGLAFPAGADFYDDTDSGGEDYCRVSDLIGALGVWMLTGTVVDGLWEWDGSGRPTDHRGNAIYSIKARH